MSGRKNTLLSHSFGSQNAGVNYTTPITDISYLDDVGYQIIIGGTPSGTIDVQLTADSRNGGQNWLTAITHTITAGSPSPIIQDLNLSPTLLTRCVWTHTGGAGTIEFLICGKAV